jgi:hypothetical protein
MPLAQQALSVSQEQLVLWGLQAQLEQRGASQPVWRLAQRW